MSDYVHGVHLVQRVTKRDGALAARGKYHLSQHGPATLCGVQLDLGRTNRTDLYVTQLLDPEHGLDVCAECVEALGQLRPDLIVEGDQLTDHGQDDPGPAGLGGVRVEA